MARQLRLCTDQESDPAWDPDTDTQTHLHSYFMGPKLLCVCLAFHTNFLASLFGVGSVTKGPSEQTNCHGAVPEMSH